LFICCPSMFSIWTTRLGEEWAYLWPEMDFYQLLFQAVRFTFCIRKSMPHCASLVKNNVDSMFHGFRTEVSKLPMYSSSISNQLPPYRFVSLDHPENYLPPSPASCNAERPFRVMLRPDSLEDLAPRIGSTVLNIQSM